MDHPNQQDKFFEESQHHHSGKDGGQSGSRTKVPAKNKGKHDLAWYDFVLAAFGFGLLVGSGIAVTFGATAVNSLVPSINTYFFGVCGILQAINATFAATFFANLFFKTIHSPKSNGGKQKDERSTTLSTLVILLFSSFFTPLGVIHFVFLVIFGAISGVYFDSQSSILMPIVSITIFSPVILIPLTLFVVDLIIKTDLDVEIE